MVFGPPGYGCISTYIEPKEKLSKQFSANFHPVNQDSNISKKIPTKGTGNMFHPPSLRLWFPKISGRHYMSELPNPNCNVQCMVDVPTFG